MAPAFLPVSLPFVLTVATVVRETLKLKRLAGNVKVEIAKAGETEEAGSEGEEVSENTEENSDKETAEDSENTEDTADTEKTEESAE